MAAPRKIFRIEEIAAARLEPTGDGAQAAAPKGDVPAHHAEIMQALNALSVMMNRPARKPATAAPAAAARLRAEEFKRIMQELDAVTAATAQATHRIITAAEEIDQLADNLSATLKGKMERDLVHDISDHIIGIFEACNFQDLTGQRISKVMGTMRFIENHINVMMEIWGGVDAIKAHVPPIVDMREGDARLLNGPKLDGDHGHASQDDIDALFD